MVIIIGVDCEVTIKLRGIVAPKQKKLGLEP